MAAVVADTHSLLWYVHRSPKLSPRALEAMEDALSTGDGIFASAISLVEIRYLVEKGKQPPEALARVRAAFEDEAEGFNEVPVSIHIADALASVPRSAVPDMPDRIIGATALHLGLRLVSRDHRLKDSPVETIW